MTRRFRIPLVCDVLVVDDLHHMTELNRDARVSRVISASGGLFHRRLHMGSRRPKSDRFFTEDYPPEVYTPTGLAWIRETDMKTILLRHYPQLAPAVQRVSNVFAPWSRVG